MAPFCQIFCLYEARTRDFVQTGTGNIAPMLKTAHRCIVQGLYYLSEAEMQVNIYVACILFLMGVLSGAATGLFFHRKDWLGGYASWRRRPLRLGLLEKRYCSSIVPTDAST